MTGGYRNRWVVVALAPERRRFPGANHSRTVWGSGNPRPDTEQSNYTVANVFLIQRSPWLFKY
jgi:hypothetical protein